jgi:hypothetical protein
VVNGRAVAIGLGRGGMRAAEHRGLVLLLTGAGPRDAEELGAVRLVQEREEAAERGVEEAGAEQDAPLTFPISAAASGGRRAS